MSQKRTIANSRSKETASHGSRRCEALGIIVPVEWDPSGNPSAWAISTYDENLYQIDITTQQGRALGLFLGRKIMLTGFLDETGEGCQKIEVETYELLDDKQTAR